MCLRMVLHIDIFFIFAAGPLEVVQEKTCFSAENTTKPAPCFGENQFWSPRESKYDPKLDTWQVRCIAIDFNIFLH